MRGLRVEFGKQQRRKKHRGEKLTDSFQRDKRKDIFMHEFPKGLKSWIEATEKILVIATLSVGIFKGFGYLSAKTEQAETTVEKNKAITLESKRRIETLNLVANTYTKELKQINEDIRDIDARSAKLRRENIDDWEKNQKIRSKKTEDRQEILKEMGKQIIELQKFSIERQAIPKQPE